MIGFLCLFLMGLPTAFGAYGAESAGRRRNGGKNHGAYQNYLMEF
jgi:hypothetical protein